MIPNPTPKTLNLQLGREMSEIHLPETRLLSGEQGQKLGTERKQEKKNWRAKPQPPVRPAVGSLRSPHCSTEPVHSLEIHKLKGCVQEARK